MAEAEPDDIIFLQERPIVADQTDGLLGEGEADPGSEEGQTHQEDVAQAQHQDQTQAELQHYGGCLEHWTGHDKTECHINNLSHPCSKYLPGYF